MNKNCHKDKSYEMKITERTETKNNHRNQYTGHYFIIATMRRQYTQEYNEIVVLD